MDIYLIRHTSVHNPLHLCYGQTDIALPDTFIDEASQLSSKLENVKPDLVYCSTLKRTIDLAKQLELSNYKEDIRLLEMNFGAWEQQPWSDIPAEELNPWMSDFVNVKVPEGESFKEMHERCITFFEELITNSSQSCFLITHAGVIRSLLAHCLEIPLSKVFQLQIDYASVSKISIAKQHGCCITVGYVNR